MFESLYPFHTSLSSLNVLFFVSHVPPVDAGKSVPSIFFGQADPSSFVKAQGALRLGR